MRTGADYRETLRSDGRKVWVLGEGRVDDVTTHPATSAMVDEYVAWYDRHLDPAWQDILIAPPSGEREAAAWAYVLPKNLARPGRHGPLLRQDAVLQRRQHHAHAGLRPSDLDGRADRGAGEQRFRKADRRCDGVSRD